MSLTKEFKMQQREGFDTVLPSFRKNEAHSGIIIAVAQSCITMVHGIIIAVAQSCITMVHTKRYYV